MALQLASITCADPQRRAVEPLQRVRMLILMDIARISGYEAAFMPANGRGTSLRERRMADRRLDARNLTCPLPVLKLRKALQDMEAGQSVEMLATDPGALEDVPNFCKASGSELLETAAEDANIYRFVIRKGGA